MIQVSWYNAIWRPLCITWSSCITSEDHRAPTCPVSYLPVLPRLSRFPTLSHTGIDTYACATDELRKAKFCSISHRKSMADPEIRLSSLKCHPITTRHPCYCWQWNLNRSPLFGGRKLPSFYTSFNTKKKNPWSIFQSLWHDFQLFLSLTFDLLPSRVLSCTVLSAVAVNTADVTNM